MTQYRDSVRNYLIANATTAGVPWRDPEEHVIEFQHLDGHWIPPPPFLMGSVYKCAAIGSYMAAVELLSKNQPST